ncbi:MAG: Bax inhibitor-1/YccA family protein [Clostridia bacterium]|nr:Bax inhibitor-1/YccA family protein [Clostridia bacterium]
MTFNGNPSLRRVVRGSEEGKYTSEDNSIVSMKGMALKSVILCVVTIISAVLSAFLLLHFIDTANTEGLSALIMVLAFSAIPLLIISFVIMFFPKTAGVLGFVYCVLEGVVMGVISALFDMLVLPGIALMAFLGTCVVFLVCWLVFTAVGKRLSSKFVKFVLVSFISMLILEGVGFLLSWAIPAFAAIMNNIWIQLAVSAVMILWASFMILIDLNNMHRLVENRADKKYEWFAAFSLVTTLMWLYLEILELLAKLALLAKRD